MQVAAMFLGCLLAGQAPDMLLSAPTGQEKRSPAVLEPTIKAATDVTDAVDRILCPGFEQGGFRPAQSAGNGRQCDGIAAGQHVGRSAMDIVQRVVRNGGPSPAVGVDASLLAPGAGGRRVSLLPGSCSGGWDGMKSSGGDAALRVAQASAAATLHQAELEATEAQYELARLLRLPGGAALPLPADRPHVGAYRTNFQAMFAGRTPPEPAALMDRILPIRRRAIDEQAAAVQAAEDVLAAATDQQPNGRSDAADVVACSQELLRQQRAFLRTVGDYNRNIAEYALVVTGPAATPQALVAILIGPMQQAIPAGAVQTAGANERLVDPDAASGSQRLENDRADACPATRRREEERADLGAAARLAASSRQERTDAGAAAQGCLHAATGKP